MKAFAILPAAAVAILAFNISSASAQGNACGKEYQACMDSCATKSSKNLQGNCFTSCEARNNLCSEKIYGKRPAGGIVTAAPKAQAKDALAKKEKELPPQEQAAEEPQQKEAPQAASQQQQPQRAPAKR